MSKSDFSLVVKTQAGLEQILADEIILAGGNNIEILQRAVKCQADMAAMYRINYGCRTALRVLKVVAEFEVANEEELYNAVKKYDWQTQINVDQTIAVNATISNNKMTHSHYVSQKTKDAIVDQFREKLDKRPNVDIEDPDLRVHVHIRGNSGMLLLDSSGDSLHKRGYRFKQGIAPINEVTAAGMIQLTGWDAKTDFLDPMCGSGTLLCEAAMFAKKIPPGYFRKKFGFMSWKDFDKELWENIVATENAKIAPAPCSIFGADVNQAILATAKEIIQDAGLADDIGLKHVAFENSTAPNPEGGIIVTNPPYGERIKKSDILEFYAMIGDTLKKRYPGYEAWLITSDPGALKSVGLRTSRKIQLFNGPLECRFVKYELYKGSRKGGVESGL